MSVYGLCAWASVFSSLEVGYPVGTRERSPMPEPVQKIELHTLEGFLEGAQQRYEKENSETPRTHF